MTLTQQQLVCGLSARAEFSNVNVSGKATVGDTSDIYTHPLANVVYAFGVDAAATGNVATLTVSSGVVAQTTGSPVISNGAGKDFEGVTLPTVATLHGIRLRAKSDNASAVVITGSTQLLPDVDLSPGADLVLNLPSAGVAISTLTMAATFATAGDTLYVEVLGQTA